MARRDRVPRHKSHTHKRNKNAKLSPFQREQKREKLANQVPTAKTIGSLDSIPHSQRRIFEYLQEARARQQAKRAALKQENPETNAEVCPTPEGANDSRSTSRKKTAAEKGAPAAAVVASAASPAPSVETTKKVSNHSKFASLNEELCASVGAALQPLSSRYGRLTAPNLTDGTCDESPTVEEIIARKKERKHKRKQEERRIRVAAKMQEIEEELDAYTKSTNGSGSKRSRKKKNGSEGGGVQGESSDEVRERVNLAFERKLRSMKKEEEDTLRRETAEAAVTAAARRKGGKAGERKRCRDSSPESGKRSSGNADAAAQQQHRKHISFNPDVEQQAAAADASRTDTLHKKRRPQEFYELVDVVRYGERVEAPPVFDVVPNRNAAVSRLANALEREEGPRHHSVGAAEERHRLLAGGGQLAQQKRLARLGLAPAITQTTRADGTTKRVSKEEEIKALRDRVVETYQRNRRKTVMERKGVNMRHEFPRFS